MIKFKDLTEAKETVVFGFGRFNPPTTGHEKLIEKVASVAGSNPFFIYPSHTTGPKDPLPHAKKVAWMRKMFPKYKKNIIADRNAKTAIQIAEKLYKDGYKNLVMVAGSDRLKEFDTLLQKYNDAPDKKGNQLFKFDSVKVVSAGERDPDAEGVEGMSASKMRAAASDGKFDDFKTGIPATLNDADKKKLYFEVRKNMGIREERQMGDDYDLLRDAYLTGKIWNVGEVVEAKGNRGEVVRKGTNYLSFVTEDGKVHKAWLHEIENYQEDKEDDDLQKTMKIANTKMNFAKRIKQTRKQQKSSLDRIKDKDRKKETKKSQDAQVKDIKNDSKRAIKSIQKLKMGEDSNAWLHEILVEEITKKDLDQVERYADKIFAKVGIDVEFTRHFMDRVNDARNKKPITTSELTRLFKQSFKKYGKKIAQLGPDAEAVINDMKTDVNMPFVLNLKGQELELVAKTVMRKKDFKTSGPKLSFEDLVGGKQMSGPTGQIFALKSEEVELDERNYKKEYANYGGKPEQIARRSSRNKARRAMGDKAVKGMDVGHADNNPLNNDPKNLRNEDPSKNRREPRLREEDEIDETWYNDLSAKMSQIIHPKGWERVAKEYAAGMKDPENRKHPSSWAQTVSNKFKGIEGRQLIKYINKLVDGGKLPKELKAELQTEEETMQTFADLVKHINEVKQDKDVKDKEGTQPAKYYAGDMAKSTKDKRDAHFKAKKSGPAPGDDDAKTKPSTHTKKFKQMFGEVLPDGADQGDYIDDFEKSDAPQFKGKSKEKRKDMAIAAYLSKNESLLDNVNKMLSESGHTDVASMKNKVQIAMSALQKMEGELGKLGDEDDLPTWWTNKVATAVSRLDDMSDYLDTQVEEFELNEKIEGLVTKAEKSGMPYGILKKVYDRGMAAWKTGHRPGTTPQQWAFARVNSFVTKSSGTWGKADADLAKQVRGESVEEEKPCWNGFKQVGMKTKGNKQVPNCVPEETTVEACCDDCDDLYDHLIVEAEYQGKKVELNNPIRTSENPNKKFKVYTMGPSGKVVVVRFGDPNMGINRDDPKARAAFRSRHSCDEKKDKTTAGYWSCYQWRASSKVDN